MFGAESCRERSWTCNVAFVAPCAVSQAGQGVRSIAVLGLYVSQRFHVLKASLPDFG